MPTAVNDDATLNIIELGTTSGFSFHSAFWHLSVSDTAATFGFRTPPKRLRKAEQRLLEDRHHQSVDNGPAGLLRFDEPRLLQYGEMRRHGRLRHDEVVRQLPR